MAADTVPGGARATTTIRSRLTGVVVVPSVILLVMWAVFSSYTVFDAIYIRAIADGVKEASIPGVNTFAALQRERQLTMTSLGSNAVDEASLQAQHQVTDRAVGDLRAALDGLAGDAPAEVNAKVATLTDALAELGRHRSQVAAGTASRAEVYAYYNGLLDAGTALFDTQARLVPDPVVMQSALNAVGIFRAGDRMSRASSVAAAAIAAGAFDAEQHVEFTSLVGAYRAELANTAMQGTERVRTHFESIVAGEAWQRLRAAEDALIGTPPAATAEPEEGIDGERPELPVSAADWRTVGNTISEELIKLSVEQATDSADLGLERGNDQFTQVIISSLIALLAVVAGIVAAVRISRRLVNRALVTRLEQLKNDSLRLAHERLPRLVERLGHGERVDVAAEVPPLDYGTDEIGQVADAFNAAQYTAVAAAVKESQAREGVNRVFLGIAHRHQGLVHRQLKILDRMEREEENPEQLDALFQLDHLATRARRNAENLIILAGEQPGRQWRKPVRLLDILRAAVAETEQYVRVRVNQVPDIALRGVAVADTIHLIAELVDNAASFSPPRSQVEVHTSRVSGGTVVEIEDHGLGMTAEDREQANRMLASPPEFDAMALRGESRLGLFVVARLAARRSIRVELRESPYGGSVAMVFLPADIVAEPVEYTSDREPPSPRPRSKPAASGPEVPRARSASAAQAPAQIDKYWSDAEDDRLPEDAQWPQTDEESTIPVSGPLGSSTANGVGESPRQAPAESNGHSDEKPALPRRRRQQNLAPQLRGEPLVTDWSARPEPEVDDESAERVRDTMAAFQRGTRQARRADPAVEPGGDSRESG